MHKLRHQRGHCDGSPYCNRRQLPTNEVDDLGCQDICAMRKAYNKIHIPDIPFRILQTPLSSNFHQKGGYVRQEEARRCVLLSVSRLPEMWVARPYHYE